MNKYMTKEGVPGPQAQQHFEHDLHHIEAILQKHLAEGATIAEATFYFGGVLEQALDRLQGAMVQAKTPRGLAS